MALIPPERQVPILLVIVALAVGYPGFTGYGIDAMGMRGVLQTRDSIASRQKTLDSLTARIDSAKKLLAQGSVADLRKTLENYRGSLELLRRLVPEQNEVANLMDEISSKAKVRGVYVVSFSPLTAVAGPPPFETKLYSYSVMGRYDQVGEFLADVASLPRIIVPGEVTLSRAEASRAKVLGDTSGALLEAKFQVKTYVKNSTPEGPDSGT